MPPIRAVASVGLVEFGHAVEMLVDRLPHLPSQDLGQRPLRTSAIQGVPPLTALTQIPVHHP
jgi:hypothetical protein